MYALYLCALMRGVEEKLYICDVQPRGMLGRQFTAIGEKVEKVIGHTGNYTYTDRLIGSLRASLKDSDPVQTARILEFTERNSGKIAYVTLYDPMPAALPVDNQYRQPNYPATA